MSDQSEAVDALDSPPPRNVDDVLAFGASASRITLHADLEFIRSSSVHKFPRIHVLTEEDDEEGGRGSMEDALMVDQSETVVAVVYLSSSVDAVISSYRRMYDKDNNVLLIYSRPNAYHALGVDMGIGLEQLEDCPEYSAS